MPRYVFHFTDGIRRFTDNTGIELTGVAAARAHAVSEARNMSGLFSERTIQDWSGWKVIVINVEGEVIFEIGLHLKPLPAG